MNRKETLRQQEGFALVTAILVLFVILLLGFAVLETVDVQSHQTGHELAGEEAFNLAESAMRAEATLLQNNWPTSTSTAYPVCTQSSTPGSTCPGGSLSAGFNPTYAGSGFSSPVWSVQVIGDFAPYFNSSYYSDQYLSQAAHYDSGDNKLWIRADATVNGQHRIVVAQAVRQSEVLHLPAATITSGGVNTENNGNKVIIEGKDPKSGLTGEVNLRCNSDGGNPSEGDNCAGWNGGKGQLDPTGDFQESYVDPSTNYQAIAPNQLQALRATAQAEGTYYAAGTCPPFGAAAPAGQPSIVFVENANCTYNGQGGNTWFCDPAYVTPCASGPGAIVVATGSLSFNGNATVYGVIYMANGQGTVPSSGPCTSSQQDQVLTVHGGAAIYGGVFVDKCGLVDAGEAGDDIVYDSYAFGGFEAFSSPSLALSTFRILSNS